MTTFHEVELEIVRPGPPHNQLLSPLTSYMALCGEGSPVTFGIPAEHRQLLNRLESLRYVTPGEGDRPTPVPERIRQAGVSEMGEFVSGIFARITTLIAELAHIRGHDDTVEREAIPPEELVHLRLVLSGSELSLIPFEFAVSPQSFPGEEREFFLQSNLPVVVTREIRRTRAKPRSWNPAQRPKILFVYAEPEGMSVPARAHLQALREAIDPWVKWSEAGIRLDEIKRHLRVLPNASIEDIYEACASDDFTHVHILAHGSHEQVAGEERYGIALCRDDDAISKKVVSGRELAHALQAEHVDSTHRSQPLFVSLATCDSGNQGSVLVPAGSIAHELHSDGIPWVIASQLPLTKLGSVRFMQDLYPRILRGDDPRKVVFEARRKLYMSADGDHDWASIVAYVSVDSERFDAEVQNFFDVRTRDAIEEAFRRAQMLVSGEASGEGIRKSTVEDEHGRILDMLAVWRARLPAPDSSEHSRQRAECFGMHGSVHKRIGLHYSAGGLSEAAKASYERAFRYYQKAMQERTIDGTKFHWVATQYLSIAAVLGKPRDAFAYERAHRLAQSQIESEPDPRERAWAHATLAELELLAPYHRIDDARADNKDGLVAVRERVLVHCRAIVSLAGQDSFQVESTCRQFNRYVDYWQNPAWGDVAQIAVGALSG